MVTLRPRSPVPSLPIYTLERKTMYLPMTSPRCCLTGLDWFRGWQHARMMDSVPRGEGVPVFPALTNQGWSKIPMTAGAAADWMRQILLHGPPKDRVDRLRTHSCKTTTLSWLSKFGVSLEIRSQLGYHQTQLCGWWPNCARWRAFSC